MAQRRPRVETLCRRSAGRGRAPRAGAWSMNARGMSSQRWLLVLVGVAVALTIAGAVSFVGYTSRAAPDAHRVAVAPFDLFVSGLDPWRVQLAHRVTDRIAAQ